MKVSRGRGFEGRHALSPRGRDLGEETVYEGEFGECAASSGTMTTPDSVGWNASTARAVTGEATMQLVEQGQMELDEPAHAVIPCLGKVEVLDGFFDDGQPTTRLAKPHVVPRHRLTQTSALPVRSGTVTSCPASNKRAYRSSQT